MFQDYLFFDLGIDRIIVDNAIDNTASRRVKKKTGATLIGPGILRHRNGEDRTERWEVTRASWAKHRGRSLDEVAPSEVEAPAAPPDQDC